MEFLVQFQLDVPAGAASSDIEHRESAEVASAKMLAEQGHLVRLWQVPVESGVTRVLGLYRAGSTAELDALLGALPLFDWMHISITPLFRHPNDPLEVPANV